MSKNHVGKSETVAPATAESVAAKAAEEAEFAKLEAEEAAKNVKTESASAVVTEERPKAVSVLARARVVEPVKVEEPPVPVTVKVIPLRTQYQVRIGPDQYDFEKSKAREVPREIVPHLERCGIIAPAIH